MISATYVREIPRNTTIGTSKIYLSVAIMTSSKIWPWLTNIISQVKPLSSQHYHHYYLIIYKTASQKRMQWLHHSLCLGMGIQQIQEHVHFTFKKETIDKLIKLGQSNHRIYVDLASKERKLLSEIVRDPNIISNRKYASKENN